MKTNQVPKNYVVGLYLKDCGIQIDNRGNIPVVRISRKHEQSEEFILNTDTTDDAIQKACGFNTVTVITQHHPPDPTLLAYLLNKLGDRK